MLNVLHLQEHHTKTHQGLELLTKKKGKHEYYLDRYSIQNAIDDGATNPFVTLLDLLNGFSIKKN